MPETAVGGRGREFHTGGGFGEGKAVNLECWPSRTRSGRERARCRPACLTWRVFDALRSAFCFSKVFFCLFIILMYCSSVYSLCCMVHFCLIVCSYLCFCLFAFVSVLFVFWYYLHFACVVMFLGAGGGKKDSVSVGAVSS